MLSSSKPTFSLAGADDTDITAGEGAATALYLLGLLLKCAEFISTGDLAGAGDFLPEIFELSTPFGSPAARVAAFFGHALHARLLSASLRPIPIEKLKTVTLVSQMRKFHSALQAYNFITPFVKFSHFTANQAIYEALDGEDRVHVIDLDIMQGLQWPGLFHILASRTKKPLSVRVTGFGPCSELLSQTGKRLAEFAESLGLPFEFNPVEGKIGNLADPGRVTSRPDEVTVVHWMHHSLYDITGSDLGTLRLLSAVRPRLVTMVEQDMDMGQTGSFVGRFVEALHYYSALFDALGEGLGRDNLQRHQVEQQLFGCEIRNILAVGGPKRRINRGDWVARWGDELIRVGFEPVSLAGSPATQASLLLGMFPWKGYTLMEENGCLRLGWKDLPLLTASAWQPSEFNSAGI
uniref:Uncharacterized protein n=1 Tax=Opuntia streptacantha TaxID=393608 RepID=A0A7C8ZB64_OPUST